MQSFKEFLNENYEMNEEDFNNIDMYTKRVIEKEYEEHIKCFVN